MRISIGSKFFRDAENISRVVRSAAFDRPETDIFFDRVLQGRHPVGCGHSVAARA